MAFASLALAHDVVRRRRSASAHARVSPAVSVVGQAAALQPGGADREERPDHDEIVMTVPTGFGIDSFVPPPRVAPAAAADRVGRQRGDPEGDLDRRATCRPARTRCSSSSPSPRRPRRTRSRSQQTYSDGSIVNWAGPESSATPAPTIEVEELARRRRRVGADDHRARRRRARARGGRVRARQRRPRGRDAGMRRRGRTVGAARRRRGRRWCCPSAASAHAYLIKTVPAASGVLNAPPPNVAADLRRGRRAAVRDHLGDQRAGEQETTGPVARSPANPDTLVVPLRPHLPQGWYLIYWRAISVDGHPVQGAFTYAVGPNPGPAPQFPVPNISATATTPRLLITRWLMFLSVMAAIGLFVLRLLIARPVSGACRGRACARCRSRS